jgi:parallel beta-helix repeat protein
MAMRTIAWMALAFLMLPLAWAECIAPFTGMQLSSSRILCAGEYEVENIVVGGSGIIVECNATVLKGAQQGAGISVEYAPDTTIRGCTLDSFEVGISVKGSGNVVLENNRFIGNKFGIAEQESSTILKNNVFEGSVSQDVVVVERTNETAEELIEDMSTEQKWSPAGILRQQLVLRSPSESAEAIEEQVEQLLQQMESSQEYLDIQRTISVDEAEGTTTISLGIVPKQPVHDVRVYEGIPKCVAEYVHQIIFSNQDYEVIEADPLLMWSFAQLEDRKQLSYTVAKKLSQQCTSLLTGFGIATPSPEKKPLEQKAQKKSTSGAAFGILLVLFISILGYRWLMVRKR